MTDFTKLNAEAQALIDNATTPLNAQIAKLTADLAACQAGSGGGGGDTTAPSVPAGLVATVQSASAITLTWNASTDAVGVTSYEVYRNGMLIGARVGISYADSGLTAATAYAYSVKAKDAAGNVSAMSATVSATTTAAGGGGTGGASGLSGVAFENYIKANSGIPAGTTLTPYTGPQYIQTASTITGKLFTRGVELAKISGMTFKSCKFTGSDTWGVNGDQAHDLVFEDCEFSGFQKAILGQGTFLRCNIHNVTIGITLKGGTSIIKGNWVHDLTNPSGLADPHYDCIFMGDALRDCVVEDNFLTTPRDHGTSSVFIATQGYGNGIFNTLVNHNRMLGVPSAGMYVVNQTAPVTGTRITNNEIERGNAGYWIIQNATAVRTGNKDAFSGANIDNA